MLHTITHMLLPVYNRQSQVYWISLNFYQWSLLASLLLNIPSCFLYSILYSKLNQVYWLTLIRQRVMYYHVASCTISCTANTLHVSCTNKLHALIVVCLNYKGAPDDNYSISVTLLLAYSLSQSIQTHVTYIYTSCSTLQCMAQLRWY